MTDARIPFIVFGDGPRYHSGLARIARDLTARLYVSEEELGIRVMQVALDGGQGWHFQAWPLFGFQQTEKEFGRRAMDEVLEELRQEGAPTPIIFMITDPARCFDLTRPAEPSEKHLIFQSLLGQASFWGYFPIDAHNLYGAVGGPAAEAVKACERVIAYGRYGAGVLKRTLAQGTEAHWEDVPMTWLPHGLEPGAFIPRLIEQADEGFQRWASLFPDWTGLRIGCVATNQPRKDLALYFGTLSALQKHGVPVLAWLHTDKMTHAWDVGQLAYDFQIPKERIYVSRGELSDAQLAARYSWCDLTIAPGLGEGFGYPIVESLACGTPCVHGAYAGGVELMPAQWLIPPQGWRMESCYNLFRPVYKADDFAAKAMAIGPRDFSRVPLYSRSVKHLGWDQLWPRWKTWISKGIQAHRTQLEVASAPAQA